MPDGIGTPAPQGTTGSPIPVDPFRPFRFPNAIREQRQRAGFPSLLSLAERLPHIPYIRLSRIERGEVFARAGELRAIAASIGLGDAGELLVDVESDSFSVGIWAGRRGYETESFNPELEELAMLLAAAFRARRSGDADLTLATLQDRFGLPAVMVSRIENAARAFDRWNVETVQSLCALFGVTDRAALASHLRREFGEGTLDDWLPRVPGAAERQKQTRDRVAALRAELEREPVFAPPPRHDPAHPHAMPQQPAVRSAPPLLTIMGVPIGDGLIEPFPGPQSIAPPPGTGARAYALRMCRTSLGDTIPGSAVLIVDPDRYPVHGGIAVLQEKRGLRVITVTTDRSGHLFGHSINPKKQIALDAYAPADLAMVTAVLFP